MVALGTVALATGAFPVAGFWSSYVLDIVGPAWVYILFRGLFRREPTALSKYFTPEVTVVSFTAICFLIEWAQYLQIYEAHFDPLDLLAYVSVLWPVYFIDRWLLNRRAARQPDVLLPRIRPR